MINTLRSHFKVSAALFLFFVAVIYSWIFYIKSHDYWIYPVKFILGALGQSDQEVLLQWQESIIAIAGLIPVFVFFFGGLWRLRSK